MPRQISVSGQNAFTRGLITEATGLNFPEDACTETYNCIFQRKGSVKRRLGIDFESSYQNQTVDRADGVVNGYYWKAAAGDGNYTLAVVQVGTTLYFYKVGSSALSTDMIDTIDLNTHKVAGAPDVESVECQFASGNGYLFVSHPYLETIYIAYDPTTDTVSATEITIYVRDFDGVDDGLDIDERPTTLSDEHHYNLLNQGWFIDFFYSDAQGPRLNVITRWFNARADYPSNADVWTLYIIPGNDNNPFEFFDPNLGGSDDGNTPASKGHYILKAFYKDRSTESGVSNLDVVSSGYYRPSTVAFFAGRAWYSGVTGQSFSNKIYFSQITEDEAKYGDCYQQNDPTSRETFSLLATDGGVITIPEAGTVIKLWPIQNAIMVFASNGVWAITGSEGIGFKATDFSVNKVSDIGALTSSSFVSVGGFPAWWNEEGIFLSTGIDVSGNTQVTPLIDNTIREFYDDIPQDSKRYVKGAYNTRTSTIQWIYRSVAPTDITEAYEFDRVLNFNTITTGFYPWSIDNSTVSINGILAVEGQGSTTSLVDVTNSALANVTNAALQDVQVSDTETVNLSSVTKYITSVANMSNYDMTFSDQNNANYLDWETYDATGVDFSSYFVTGYLLRGDAQRRFEPTYIYIYNKTNSEENKIDFQSQWGFANSSDANRWSTTQRLTFPNDDYDYQHKRIKTRGHGLSLQFKISSVTGEPFEIVGWSIFETQNQLI